MPTIPLYDASAPADGYHRVMAPGGYECWRVFAGASQLEIVFLEGNYLSLAYESAYKRYLAAPTRVAPPVPRDYPLVVIGLADHIFRPPAAKGAFHFVSEPPTVTIGNSSILWSSHRLLVITLAAADASGRVTLEGQLMLDLTEPAAVKDGEVRGGGRLTGVVREPAKDVVHRIDEDALYSHAFSVRPKWER